MLHNKVVQDGDLALKRPWRSFQEAKPACGARDLLLLVIKSGPNAWRLELYMTWNRDQFRHRSRLKSIGEGVSKNVMQLN